MDVFNGTNAGLNLWSGTFTSTLDYQERAAYDPNGNIKTYIRHGFGSTTESMDSLIYNYTAGTNKLNSITDGASATNYTTDIKTQAANNYTYDAAGNLLTDQQAGITSNMTWSVYGKLLSITSENLTYLYDAVGNRVGKTSGTTNTWYVRDAQGNVMSVYSGTGSTMSLQEQELYGSSRLGMIGNATAIAGTAQYLDNLGSGTIYTFTRGNKLFELSNHLGNVLATISDKKIGSPVSGAPSQAYYYTADVKTAQDYYPGGMELPGRTYTATNQYRYGYQGSEKDKELNTNTYTTLFREVDTRINRWWSPDPKSSASPWSSPYVVNGNNPIIMIDPNGDKEYRSGLAYFFATGKFKLGKGDWYKSDRTGNTDTWKNANNYNLQQEKGYNEYTNIEQRASFYSWFQEDTKARGYDTKWAGAASGVAFAINELANPTILNFPVTWVAKGLNYTSSAAIDFANTGNRMIFEDVFPKLKALSNGPALKGQDAKNWDAMALSQEQTLIQPLYETTKDFGQVAVAATQTLAFAKQLAWMKGIDIAPFPKNGNMMDISQRWAYGMQAMKYSVTPSQRPMPGATYENGTMYLKFRGAVDLKYWNQRK